MPVTNHCKEIEKFLSTYNTVHVCIQLRTEN